MVDNIIGVIIFILFSPDEVSGTRRGVGYPTERRIIGLLYRMVNNFIGIIIFT